MLRGPVQASFPSLDHFPREAGSSGHVYPFTARAASPHQNNELRLPSSIASATFWRSPYSEALRQARSSGSKRQSTEKPVSSRSQGPPSSDRGVGKENKEVKGILKGTGGSEGKDSSSDTSSENARGQIRGILCKSSLSSSSRQSGSKVQKRVKFDDSVDSRSVLCQRQTASAGSTGVTCRTVARSPLAHDQQRALSASAAGRAPVRMPSLRNDSERLQSVDRACLQHHGANQHVNRPASGAFARCASVPELSLPKPAGRDPYKHQHPASYQLLHSPHSSISGMSSSKGGLRLSPTELEFRIYRRSSSGQAGVTTQSDPQPSPSYTQSKTKFFVTRSSSSSNDGGSRAVVRLTRSLTSPSITVSRPVKRPTPACTQDDLPLVLTSSRAYPPTQATPTNVDFNQQRNPAQKEGENDEDDHQSFLDEDKTVQILHWLKEVDHKQAREGRCPVFVNGIYREG